MTTAYGVAFGALVVFGMGCPKACVPLLISGETKSALDAVRKCPRAMSLLGADPAPSWVGCTQGEGQSGCDSGSGEWSVAVAGARARGTLEMHVLKEPGQPWVPNKLTLEIGKVSVDVLACKDLAVDAE
jgi:hypothetical protein